MTGDSQAWDVASDTSAPRASPRWDQAAFRDGIERTLQDLVSRQGDRLAELGPDAALLVEAARASVSGGKRFRASFCWWGHLAVARPDDEAANKCR